jgi:hypothetical protein
MDYLEPFDPKAVAEHLIKDGKIETENLFRWLEQRLTDEADFHNLTLMMMAGDIEVMRFAYTRSKE